MKFLSTSIFAMLLMSVSFLADAQSPQPDTLPDGTIKYPVQKVPLSRVVYMSDTSSKDWYPAMKNTTVMPAPGVEVSKDEFRRLKEEANKRKREMQQKRTAPAPDVDPDGEPTPSGKMGVTPATPTQGENYFGPTTSGTPNDNDIAVSKGCKVVAVVNTSIQTFSCSSIGTGFKKSLASFVGIPGNAFVFDPKVAYDPAYDRFIVIFLEGNSTATSKVHIGFTATNDPFGAWNVYAVSGVVANKWTDFPQIAIGTEEVFITGNSANDGSGGVIDGAIWQIGKMEGYNGASLNVKTYAIPEVGFHPVQGGKTLYGPDCYFIRALQVPFASTKAVFVRRITNTIGNGGTLTSMTTLNASTSYSTPPNADQQNGNELMTNGCAITSSYLENNRIQYAHNTDNGGRPSIMYGTIVLSPLGLNFSAVTTSRVTIDSFHIAYPGLAYCGTDGAGKNKSILGFDFASSNHFPGNAAVEIDESHNVSAPVVLKYGFAPITAGSTTPGQNRWGDYAGAYARVNNPGEMWFAGNIGRSGSSSNGTWMSQVYGCGATPIAVEDEIGNGDAELKVYPNPSVEMVKVEFAVAKAGAHSTQIIDLEGKVIETFGPRNLKPGTAFFEFNTTPLPNGTYIVKVLHEKETVSTSKLVIAH